MLLAQGKLQVYHGISSGAPNLYDESGSITLTPESDLAHRFESPDGLFMVFSSAEITEEDLILDFNYGFFKPLESGEGKSSFHIRCVTRQFNVALYL